MNARNENSWSAWVGDRTALLAIACFVLVGSSSARRLAVGEKPDLVLAVCEGVLVLLLVLAAFQRPLVMSKRQLLLSCVVAALSAVSIRLIGGALVR
jgi:hypothetical protein